MGPNTTTWYGILFGWILTWATPDYAFVLIVVIGPVCIIADSFSKQLHQDSGGRK